MHAKMLEEAELGGLPVPRQSSGSAVKSGDRRGDRREFTSVTSFTSRVEILDWRWSDVYHNTKC